MNRPVKTNISLLCRFAVLLWLGFLPQKEIFGQDAARWFGRSGTVTTGFSSLAFSNGSAVQTINPAGLALLKERDVSMGAAFFLPRILFADEKLNIPVEQNLRPVFPTGLGFNYFRKKGGGFHAGLFLYQSNWEKSHWPEAWHGRFWVTERSFQAWNLQPTVSYFLGERVALGFSGNFILAHTIWKFDLPYVNESFLNSTATLSGPGYGLGLKAGITVRATDFLFFGLAYHSPSIVSFENGTANFVVPQFISEEFPDTRFSANYPLPGKMGLGISGKPEEKTTLSFDAWIHFTENTGSVKYAFSDTTTLLKNLSEPKTLRNSFSFQLMGLYQIKPALHLAGKVQYNSSPLVQGFVMPDNFFSETFQIEAGVQWVISKKLSLSGSLLWEEMARKVENQDENLIGFGGTYKGKSFGMGIGLRYFINPS